MEGGFVVEDGKLSEEEDEGVLAEEEASFESVFGPLAHHLFPEGKTDVYIETCTTLFLLLFPLHNTF